MTSPDLELVQPQIEPVEQQIDWYPSNVDDRIKIEEFFDFWQCELNPALIRTSQQNHFYKILYKKDQKDEKLVQGNWRISSDQIPFIVYPHITHDIFVDMDGAVLRSSFQC